MAATAGRRSVALDRTSDLLTPLFSLRIELWCFRVHLCLPRSILRIDCSILRAPSLPSCLRSALPLKLQLLRLGVNLLLQILILRREALDSVLYRLCSLLLLQRSLLFSTLLGYGLFTDE
jgi:hypothetical protein